MEVSSTKGLYGIAAQPAVGSDQVTSEGRVPSFIGELSCYVSEVPFLLGFVELVVTAAERLGACVHNVVIPSRSNFPSLIFIIIDFVRHWIIIISWFLICYFFFRSSKLVKRFSGCND